VGFRLLQLVERKLIGSKGGQAGREKQRQYFLLHVSSPNIACLRPERSNPLKDGGTKESEKHLWQSVLIRVHLWLGFSFLAIFGNFSDSGNFPDPRSSAQNLR
jgi:hypothetical protein